MSTTGPSREATEASSVSTGCRRPFSTFIRVPGEDPARPGIGLMAASRGFSVPARRGPDGNLEAVPWLSPDHLEDALASGYLGLAALSKLEVRSLPRLRSRRGSIGDAISILLGLSFHEAYFLCGALGGRLPAEEEVEKVLAATRPILGSEPPAIWTTSLWSPQSPESRGRLAALAGNRRAASLSLRSPAVPVNAPFRTAIEPSLEGSKRRRMRVGEGGASAGLAAWIVFDR